ncbi:MAG: hypothetical protein EHM49_05755 [Deltaproteobacteria bacterium]|nr:MAG: hypothetical protein EHM49_05755 [Deltaproteobacteria bacterium]
MEEYKRAVDIAEELMNDAKRTATRETEKIINTANSIEGNAYDKIQYIIGNDANLNKLWSSVSDAIDTNFKKKLYVDNLFKTLVFDVLQLQTFLYENTVAGMINMIKNEHQRHYNYCGVTREYMLQVKHYIGEFLRVLR